MWKQFVKPLSPNVKVTQPENGETCVWILLALRCGDCLVWSKKYFSMIALWRRNISKQTLATVSVMISCFRTLRTNYIIIANYFPEGDWLFVFHSFPLWMKFNLQTWKYNYTFCSSKACHHKWNTVQDWVFFLKSVLYTPSDQNVSNTMIQYCTKCVSLSNTEKNVVLLSPLFCFLSFIIGDMDYSMLSNHKHHS